MVKGTETSLIDNLADVFKKFDIPGSVFSEAQVYDEIHNIVKGSTGVPVECKAEVFAFGVYETRDGKGSSWGTYLAPMMTFKDKYGNTREFPSISDITEDMISYWAKRLHEVKHPMLKTRYANLLWDFTDKVTTDKARYSIGEAIIENTIKIAEEKSNKYGVDTINKLKRALGLACSLNNNELKIKIINAIINYEDAIAEDNKAGLWGFSFDLLINNKNISLSAEQEGRIISELEYRYNRLVALGDEWIAEQAAMRLVSYFRKKNNTDKILEVIGKLGQVYKASIKKADPMLAMFKLNSLYKIYMDNGLKKEADEVLKEMRRIGPDLENSMETFSTKVSITKAQMDEHINGILKGGLADALKRIADCYIPKKADVERQLKELSEKAPLSFLFSTVTFDEKGRKVAEVGSLGDDIDGHIIKQISENMVIEALFLREVMKEMIKRYNANEMILVEYIFEAPVFDIEKKEIVELGIKAYLEGNYIVAEHLLIPQIEDALRNLVEIQGGIVLKPTRDDAFNYKTLNDILREESIISCFGEDISLYFRVVLSDQKGWNLRNTICHGIALPKTFNSMTADRIMHILFCLAKVRKKEVISEEDKSSKT